MKDTSGDRWGVWAQRWPRLAGAVLLATAVQSGIGALVTGEALAAYLAGCAVTGGVVGALLLIMPLPTRNRPVDEKPAEACAIFA
jgi:cytochrome c oxidase assembly factor CtaG